MRKHLVVITVKYNGVGPSLAKGQQTKIILDMKNERYR